MSACPRCGTPAPDEGRFCRSCGGHLTAASRLDGDTQPRGDPAIDDEDVQPTTEGDTVDAPRLPMQAYPVEAPMPDQWEDPPDDSWYQNPYGRQPHGQSPLFRGQGYSHKGAGYHPYDDTPQKRGHSGRALILAIVGAVAVVVLVVGGALFISSRGRGTADAGPTTYAPASRRSDSASASPSSTAETPQQQATAVNQLLNRAVNGKSMLTTAYGQALSCRISPAAATAEFDEAAKNRRAIVTSARRLDTSKLPNGAHIRQLLITMYNTSARADDAFADWARAGNAAGDSCLKRNAKRAEGNSLSVKAGKQKKSFTKAWNPVARTYNQPQRTERSL